jgi:hypothetical protein
MPDNEWGRYTTEHHEGERTLTLYSLEEGGPAVSYLVSWGSNIFEDMQVGDITDPQQVLNLHRWLSTGDLSILCSVPGGSAWPCLVTHRIDDGKFHTQKMGFGTAVSFLKSNPPGMNAFILVQIL